jgi:hypothetical protein
VPGDDDGLFEKLLRRELAEKLLGRRAGVSPLGGEELDEDATPGLRLRPGPQAGSEQENAESKELRSHLDLRAPSYSPARGDTRLAAALLTDGATAIR